MQEALIQSIISRQYTVGVIGFEYVGLPLALHFAEKGLAFIGFDIDLCKVDLSNRAGHLDPTPVGWTREMAGTIKPAGVSIVKGLQVIYG